MTTLSAARAGLSSRGVVGTLIQPARNCWRVDRAHRFHCIQDAADYFRLVRDALLRAQDTIFILGWDIAGGIDLLPGQTPADAPSQLNDLLAFVARKRPRLRCYILIWDYGAVFALERDPLTRLRFAWRMPRRVRFGFDDRHPVGGSHHQKIVVVDDALAFCGGIDLTTHRWDTSAHRVDEPGRTTPLGGAYGPYHEIQAMVDGPVAATLGALARDRWRAFGADKLPSVRPSTADLWPSEVRADLSDVHVAIARTAPQPGTGSEPDAPVRECEALFVDSITAAQRAIYIESQYFTNMTLADALAARLAEPDGPEIVIVLPKESYGWLEARTVAPLRDSVCRRLMAADAHQRLRLVCPMASRAADLGTFVHSKVMIVDDTFVRIGSANVNHRSMGVDTECDLAVEAENVATRQGIQQIRNRLIGEHLGMRGEEVAAALHSSGSLLALIDARAGEDRTLVRIELPAEPPPQPSEALKAAVDPDEPMGFGAEIDRLIPAVDAAAGGNPLRLILLPAALVAVVWIVASITTGSLLRPDVSAARGLLASVPDTGWAMLIAAGAFVLGAIALIPLELLTVAAGILLGPVRGGAVALAGSIAAAVIGYAAGRVIGPAGLSQWMSRASFRMGRRLPTQGVISVAILRLTTIASAGSIHLLCGAGRMPFWSYLAGSALGLTPAVVALTGLGALVRQTLQAPSTGHLVATIGSAVLLLALALGLRTVLAIRQFSPTRTRHQQRAEFG